MIWPLPTSEIARPALQLPWKPSQANFSLRSSSQLEETHICCCSGGAGTQNASSVSHWPVISLDWELGAVARTSPSFRSTTQTTCSSSLPPLPSSFFLFPTSSLNSTQRSASPFLVHLPVLQHHTTRYNGLHPCSRQPPGCPDGLCLDQGRSPCSPRPGRQRQQAHLLWYVAGGPVEFCRRRKV